MLEVGVFVWQYVQYILLVVSNLTSCENDEQNKSIKEHAKQMEHQQKHHCHRTLFVCVYLHFRS